MISSNTRSIPLKSGSSQDEINFIWPTTVDLKDQTEPSK